MTTEPSKTESGNAGSKATERTSTDDTLSAWADTLADALGLPDGPPTDLTTVLDLARDAAHGIARPAAPLTTFLVGYAAGLHGGRSEQLTGAIEIARRLADDPHRVAGARTRSGTGTGTGNGNGNGEGDTRENPDDLTGAPR